MGDDINSGLLSMAICFDFRSTNVVQLSNRNLYFYRFQCNHPLITQLSMNHYSVDSCSFEILRQKQTSVLAAFSIHYSFFFLNT